MSGLVSFRSGEGMAFFGKRYDAPMYDDATEIMVPVGERCVWCAQPFVSGDDGLRYVSGEFTHRSCNLRQVLGPMADSILALEQYDDQERP